MSLDQHSAQLQLNGKLDYMVMHMTRWIHAA